MLYEKKYFIIIIGIIVYIIAYLRRNHSTRMFLINKKVERLLFPFSAEGGCTFISMFLAIYIEISVPVAYILIFLGKIPEEVNGIWFKLLWAFLAVGGSVDLIYDIKNHSFIEQVIAISFSIGFLLLACIIVYGTVFVK